MLGDGHSGRTAQALRHHYDVERELAERLLQAPRERRGAMYQEVYDELFRRVPDHPQHRNVDDPATRRREIERLVAYVRRHLTPDAHFLEVGAGDCALSRRVAQDVREVSAVEVSAEIVPGDLPPNVDVKISDGVSIPAADVDVAFSNQLMEHLHPDDAAAQLASIFASLRPGGRYVCITPSRLCGPHDISQFFTETATGFHLKEYTNTELARLMKRTGFRRVLGTMPTSRGAIEHPLLPIVLVERLLELLPRSARMRLPRLVKRLLSVRVVAIR